MATNDPPQMPPGPPQMPPGPQPPPQFVAATSWAAPARWRSLHSWSHAVLATLGMVVIVLTIVLETQIEQLSVLSNRTDAFSELTRRIHLNNRMDSLNTAFWVTALFAAVVFITWMWRAAKNNEALGRQQPRLGSGWAIGGWLIPLANLVIPVLVMQDLWRGSDAKIARGDMRWKIADRSALVGWWWGLLFAGLVFNGTGNAVADKGGFSNQRQGIAIQTVGTLIRISSAVLAILVVRRIGTRQEESLQMQRAQWSPPAPPA